MGLAAARGQLVGGVLMQLDLLGLGWRAVFLINVPIGLAALLLAPRLVPESRAALGRRLDLVGLVLATLALAAAVLPLVDGRSKAGPRAAGRASVRRPSWSPASLCSRARWLGAAAPFSSTPTFSE
jgi:hypothetical protein